MSHLSKVYDQLKQVGDCWEWQGPRQKYGHGQVWLAGRTRPAYRVVWEDFHGPVPDGLELDHLCRNPPCCNPEHLEPVSHAENMRRGSQSFDNRSHCLSGKHETTPQNLITRSDGRQQCRPCRAENKRRRRALGLGNAA